MVSERPTEPSAPASQTDFIRAIVSKDMEEGRYPEVVTRFPPEPNGFLHIGHAKSIVLNFGIAGEHGGRCHLRYDDTNPLTEEARYVEAIQEDVRWLGFDFGEHLYHASDYFERMYDFAERLVRRGRAYVDSQSEEEIREGRGTVTEPGVASPFRDRSPDENLRLFRRMRAGEFPDGGPVLRARIDMAHPNMIMRDPILYRVRHAAHYRRGDRWCIYPMYDYAHCLEDAIEGVSHSLCTLEFENNREIYDWLLDEVGFTEPRPHQYEFARLNLEYTVLSKRLLLRLVAEGHVEGWDDPRMPTLAGLRRRGVPPEAIRAFCEMIGVARADSTVDAGKLEYQIRDTLNPEAPRVMCVAEPLRVVIENFPEGETDWIRAPCYPKDVGREGSRELPFGRVLYIDRRDFSEDPPSGFHRLAPGREVRLRYGYVVRCREVVRDSESGEVRELRCSYDPKTRGGASPGRRVRGTIQWVSAEHARPVELRLYDRLFSRSNPVDPGEGSEEPDFLDALNPESLVIRRGALAEPSVVGDPGAVRYQFERMGYFWADPSDSTPARPVFNRIVALRDGWSRRRRAGRSSKTAGRNRREDGRAGARQGTGVPEADPSRGTRSAKGAREKDARARERAAPRREEARRADPELAARMLRYQESHRLPPSEAEILTGSRPLSEFYEALVAAGTEARAAGAWVVNELLRETKGRKIEELPFDASALARLLKWVESGELSRIAAKGVFSEMARSGRSPEEIVEKEGLREGVNPEELERIVRETLSRWPEKVEALRGGKKGLIGFFIGRVMTRTGGRADPKRVRARIEEAL